MDQISNEMTKFLEYAVIIFGFCIFVKIILKCLKAKFKGRIGENTISYLLHRLPEEEYKVIDDVILNNQTGTTQIDHIVVSLYGIFVVETKNYKGWIIGNERLDKWTQNIYGKKTQFKNPIYQNYGHIKTLQEYLSGNIPMISIIAFPGDCTLKTSTETHVVYWGKVCEVIRQYKAKVLSLEDVDRIVSTIQKFNIDSKEVRKEHTKRIHAKIKNDVEKQKAGICPKCGGKLVERKGKYGAFIGCSNYPKCRYTRSNLIVR